MNINFHTSTPVDGEIVITLTEEDYMPAVADNLRTYRAKAEVKGFRPGQVPTSIIQKMYGPEVILRTTLDIATKHLNTYLQDHALDLLQDPIMVGHSLESTDHLDSAHPGTIEIKFACGLRPTIDLSPISQIELDAYTITGVSDELLTDAVERLKAHDEDIDIEEDYDFEDEEDEENYEEEEDYEEEGKEEEDYEEDDDENFKNQIEKVFILFAQEEANNLFMQELQQALFSHLTFDLPVNVVKEGLRSEYPDWDEAAIEDYYQTEVQNNLRWSLIIEQVVQDYDIQTSTMEVAQFLQLSDRKTDLETLHRRVEHSLVMRQPNEAYREAYLRITETKALDKIREKIKVRTQEMTFEEFNAFCEKKNSHISHDHHHAHGDDHHCAEC